MCCEQRFQGFSLGEVLVRIVPDCVLLRCNQRYCVLLIYDEDD